MRVFISHRTDGDARTARRLCDDLESRGVPTWIAPRDIDPGTTWPRAIEQGLLSSTHVVILLSERTLESRAVQQELQMAAMLQVEGKVSLVPVLLKEVALPPWLAVHQYVDLRTSYADGLAALLGTLTSTRVGALPAPGAPPLPAQAAHRPVHVVSRGERVDHLAARYLGDPHVWRALAALDGRLDPIRLRPGTQIAVPEGDGG